MLKPITGLFGNISSESHFQSSDFPCLLKSVTPMAGAMEKICYRTTISWLLLEHNERFEHTIELLVHDLERSIQCAEAKGMGSHWGWIDPLHLQQPQKTHHPQPAARAEPSCYRLFRHSNPPLHTGQVHKFALAMVADVGDRATRLGGAHAILEGGVSAQRLNGGIDTYPIRERQDALHRILLGEVHDNVSAILAGEVLPLCD